MDDVNGIFIQNLDGIGALARDGKFRACFRLTHDLTKFAAMSDLKHGVFITEVLESVLLQIGPLFSQYRIPPKDRSDMVDNVCEKLSLLSSAYKKEDKSQAYRVLEDLRFDATKFQFKCINTAERVDGDQQDAGARG